MKLSPDMQETFIEEVRTVVKYMREAERPAEKLYFFSAVFGAAFRIMNIQFDSELAFVHHVLNAAYSSMNANLALMAQGQGVITFPADVFEKLENALGELADKVEVGEKTYAVLEKIANLTYSTTGNGYYLHLKGMLKV